MKLLNLILLLVVCAFSAALNLPHLLPPALNISSLSKEIKQIDWPANLGNASTGLDSAATDPEPTSLEDDPIWCKAVGRGRKFMDAMKLNGDKALKLLNWPYLQSPWDGPLVDEMRQWGYSDNEKMHQAVDKDCDFSDFPEAFEELGVSTDSAGKGGPNNCFHVLHKNGPAIEFDASGKLPAKREQRYVVDGVRYPVTDAGYKIGVNPVNGLVYFLDRISPQSGYRQMMRTPITPEQMPKLGSSSDITWGFWNRVATPENRNNIKHFFSRDVVNEDTEHIIKIVNKRFGQDKTKQWPGDVFRMSPKEGNKVEAETALAFLGSPNGLAAGYFLTQHRRQLGDKTISKVALFHGDSLWPLPSLLFYVEDVAPGKSMRRRDSGLEEAVFDALTASRCRGHVCW